MRRVLALKPIDALRKRVGVFFISITCKSRIHPVRYRGNQADTRFNWGAAPKALAIAAGCLVSFQPETGQGDMVPPDLRVQLAPKNKNGLLLSNPVMTASGTFGYGTEYGQLFDIERLGAIVCKGTTLEPREGNPQPRLVETASGVINSIGFQNIGVRALIKEKAPVWAGWRVPVIVNIAGDTVEENGKLAKMLGGVAGVSGIEVNVSCPNVKAGGAAFGASPALAAAVTAAVRAATSLPIMVKLTPNTGDISAVALAVADAGADAISLVNSVRGMTIDIEARRPSLGNITGGLSGPAIKPLALALVYEVAGAVEVPVIGCGGIVTAGDALEFIMAGAAAVQVGSATFRNPRASLDVLEGIESFMEREGIKNLGEIRGVARG
jgi:dihydroorotate dehydrogenase (NAD+) catalytic subunit